MSHKRGFTLIELAIVILVASLLLAAVLKGGSVIRGAKVQDVITIAQDLSAAVNNFKQRYHMFPGDFPINAVTPEITGITPACLSTGAQKGDGNGLIDSGGNPVGSLGVAAEAQCVPEVLFQAGMVNKVDTDSGVSVFHTRFGGRVWVKTVGGPNGSNVVAALAAAGITFPLSPSVTHVIEFENLPCSVARDIDRQIDNDNIGVPPNIGRGAASDPACVKDTLVDYALAL